MPTLSPSPTLPLTTYARRLGLFSATMAVIGGVIGGGIFRTPAVVAQRTGSEWLSLTAWVVGGVIALAGGLCFGELGQRSPRAGGGYVYLRETFGPLPGFLYGWTELLVIQAGGTAAVAVTFAGYFAPLAGLPQRATVPVAVGAIVLLAGVNYLGVRLAAITTNVVTVLKLAALAVLIVAGLTLLAPADPGRSLALAAAPAGAWPVTTALGAALVPVLFTYGGFQQTNFLAEEIIDPERKLPRALLIGVIAIVAVYLLVNLVYLRALGVEGLAGSTAPAADAMRAALGPAGEKLIAAGIAISTFGFVNLNLLVTPRLLQSMASDGLFFRRMARLHPVYRTPTAGIMVFAGWVIVLVLFSSFSQLVEYTVFGDWVFFGLIAATLFVYRRRDRMQGLAPAPPGSFRIPGYPLTPALFILAALYVLASSVASNPRNALIGTTLIVAGAPVYFIWRRGRPQPD